MATFQNRIGEMSQRGTGYGISRIPMGNYVNNLSAMMRTIME